MNPWHDSDTFADEARKVESAGEALLLTLLWWRRDGWTVRTQEPIEQYRIDLFVPEAGVAIEVDSFGGHGSAADMERDAQKRNLVVARGWAPLSFSAQQTLFRSQDTLAEALAVIQGRIVVVRPGQRREQSSDLTSVADGSRALLAALTGGALDVHLSASERVLTNLPEVERVGIELLEVVLDWPVLIRDPEIGAALWTDGPVELAATTLRESLSPDGVLDRPGFLRACPALLYPVVVHRLGAPAFVGMFAARKAAMAIVARMGGI
jgi:very-short-patch-repair endonuclease